MLVSTTSFNVVPFNCIFDPEYLGIGEEEPEEGIGYAQRDIGLVL